MNYLAVHEKSSYNSLSICAHIIKAAWQAGEKAAERVGLHHQESNRMEDHFSPHCVRHWMTTHLRRAGMSGLHDKKTMFRQPIRTAAALLERVRGAFTCPDGSAFQDRNSHILQMQQNVNR